MPGLCMNISSTRVRVHVRSRIRSPVKKSESFAKAQQCLDFPDDLSNSFSSVSTQESDESSGNRVMVVIDSNPETKGALQWALSHTVLAQDTVVLLHVARHRHLGEDSNNGHHQVDQRAYNLLRSAKLICQQRKPEVHVEMAIREGKEKEAIIVEEAKRRRASLLVLGHKKQSILRRLRTIWSSSKRTRKRVVDYCIENANCMTVAVRRKSGKHNGGYLITTKRHKKFWLLA